MSQDPRNGFSGLRRAMEGRDLEFPMLALALEGVFQAKSFLIHWHPFGTYEIATNYTQVVRTPVGDDGIDAALTQHLAAIDEIVLGGKASYTPSDPPRHTCGGVRELLGRDPVEEEDLIELGVLRDLNFREHWAPPEWLTEFTVRARGWPSEDEA